MSLNPIPYYQMRMCHKPFHYITLKPVSLKSQNSGEVMFVSFNTFVDICSCTSVVLI